MTGFLLGKSSYDFLSQKINYSEVSPHSLWIPRTESQ